jgi:hypothetical protein
VPHLALPEGSCTMTNEPISGGIGDTCDNVDVVVRGREAHGLVIVTDRQHAVDEYPRPRGPLPAEVDAGPNGCIALGKAGALHDPDQVTDPRH